jgi:hypothetical protein
VVNTNVIFSLLKEYVQSGFSSKVDLASTNFLTFLGADFSGADTFGSVGALIKPEVRVSKTRIVIAAPAFPTTFYVGKLSNTDFRGDSLYIPYMSEGDLLEKEAVFHSDILLNTMDRYYKTRFGKNNDTVLGDFLVPSNLELSIGRKLSGDFLPEFIAGLLLLSSIEDFKKQVSKLLFNAHFVLYNNGTPGLLSAVNKIKPIVLVNLVPILTNNFTELSISVDRYLDREVLRTFSKYNKAVTTTDTALYDKVATVGTGPLLVNMYVPVDPDKLSITKGALNRWNRALVKSIIDVNLTRF